MKRQLTAIIEREGDGYASLCPELDIASQGVSIEDARNNLKEALELFFETASPIEIQQRLRKVARVGDTPNKVHQILNDIRLGREIVLRQHDVVIAKIILVYNDGEPEKWPVFYERAVGIFGKSPKSSACDSLAKTREERS